MTWSFGEILWTALLTFPEPVQPVAEPTFQTSAVSRLSEVGMPPEHLSLHDFNTDLQQCDPNLLKHPPATTSSGGHSTDASCPIGVKLRAFKFET